MDCHGLLSYIFRVFPFASEERTKYEDMPPGSGQQLCDLGKSLELILP